MLSTHTVRVTIVFGYQAGTAALLRGCISSYNCSGLMTVVASLPTPRITAVSFLLTTGLICACCGRRNVASMGATTVSASEDVESLKEEESTKLLLSLALTEEGDAGLKARLA